jgi:hypothetical protein
MRRNSKINVEQATQIILQNNNAMELLTKELIQELLLDNDGPCLSLYMPTHRSHPENQQDPIRFQSLIKTLKSSLANKYSASEVQKFLEPFVSLHGDTGFWNHTLMGLAVFSASGLYKVVGLHEKVDELAIVADSFHTKPLRQIMQTADHYHVVAISLRDFKLFEGTRHSIVEVDLGAETPTTITQALGGELTEKHTTVASYGGVGANSSSMHHGHGGKMDEVDNDTEKYFRIIAAFIYENYSKPTGCPLILAALPEHHSLFHKLSKNSLLLPTSIAANPTSISTEKLVRMAWEIMEPDYLKKINSLVERFNQAKANGKGSDDLKEVAVAAVEGKIDTLLVEANRIIAVRITNLITGNTQNKDLSNPKVDDLLDDMGELVTKMGGQVMVLPASSMPSQTGLAAIYRY